MSRDSVQEITDKACATLKRLEMTHLPEVARSEEGCTTVTLYGQWRMTVEKDELKLERLNLTNWVWERLEWASQFIRGAYVRGSYRPGEYGPWLDAVKRVAWDSGAKEAWLRQDLSAAKRGRDNAAITRRIVALHAEWSVTGARKPTSGKGKQWKGNDALLKTILPSDLRSALALFGIGEPTLNDIRWFWPHRHILLRHAAEHPRIAPVLKRRYVDAWLYEDFFEERCFTGPSTSTHSHLFNSREAMAWFEGQTMAHIEGAARGIRRDMPWTVDVMMSIGRRPALPSSVWGAFYRTLGSLRGRFCRIDERKVTTSIVSALLGEAESGFKSAGRDGAVRRLEEVCAECEATSGIWRKRMEDWWLGSN